MKSIFYRSVLLTVIFLMSPFVRAELGDYDALETIVNVFSPPAADNPVRPEQQVLPYPLLNNPSSFKDGFDPSKYNVWQTVKLHSSTNAMCGNGSPYKFFVNRVPETSNTIYYFEGGGACWDYASCSGQAGIRGARNPNGIPDNYLSYLNPSTALVSPFIFREHPWSKVKTQAWNMVYIPYCTGDIYTGDRVAVYQDESGNGDPLVWHHNGLRNVRAVVAWLKNNLQRPAQSLVTGCSAGGAGAISNYAHLRGDIAPQKSYLINDSGPVFSAPNNASPNDAPSVSLYAQVRSAWGLDNGPLIYMKARVPSMNTQDLGTLYAGLSLKFNKDRMGQTHFWQDLNFSSYSYERFHADIANESNSLIRTQKLHKLWHQDTKALKANLTNLPNFGYYFPYYRGVNDSHCSTIIDFANGDIQELGLELDDFIDNILNGTGRVLEASEVDSQADYLKPFNELYDAIDNIL